MVRRPEGAAAASGRSLLAAAVGVLALRGLSAAVAVLVIVVLGRTLEPAGLGAFLYAWGWLELLSALATLGFDPYLVRALPLALAGRDPARVRRLLRTADLWSLALAVLLVLAALATSPWWRQGLAPEVVACLLVALAILPVRVIAILRQATLIAAERPIYGLAMLPLLQPALVLLAVLLSLAWGARPTAVGVTAAAVLATVATAAFGIVATRHAIGRPPAAREDGGAAGPPLVDRWEAEVTPASWIPIVAPFFVVVLADLANTRIDLLVIGTFLGPRAAAEYGVAARASELIRFGLLAVTPVVAPAMAREAARGSRRALALVVRRASRIALAISVPLVFAVTLAAPPVLSFVGASYVAGVGVLRVLALGYLGAAVAGPSVRLLLSAGEQRTVAVVLVLGTLANLVLDLLVVGRFGLVGPAFVTAAVTVATTSALALAASRRPGVSTVAWARIPD
jgi:O-antigen/teichoic acid export membrane protein